MKTKIVKYVDCNAKLKPAITKIKPLTNDEIFGIVCLLVTFFYFIVGAAIILL